MIVIDSKGCEFGYELIMCVSYAHYLHTRKENFRVLSCEGMRPFYFFLPSEKYEERYTKRSYRFPSGTWLRSIHFRELNSSKFSFPDYKSVFQSLPLKVKFQKPLLFISNKYTSEWLGPPVNYLSCEFLNQLFDLLTPHFDIVYNRPQGNIICNDESEQPSFNLKDKGIANNYSNVYLFETLLDLHDYDFNALQLILLANSDIKISVQGGTSIVSSLLGGANLVYAVKGQELNCGSYKNWYNKLSGCNVKDFSSYQGIIEELEKKFI
jgi:hypothetical protein